MKGEWLRQCGEEKRLLPAADGYLIPLTDLTANLPAARNAATADASALSSTGQRPAQQGAADRVGGASQEPAGVGRGSAGEGQQGSAELTASQAPANQALKGFW